MRAGICAQQASTSASSIAQCISRHASFKARNCAAKGLASVRRASPHHSGGSDDSLLEQLQSLGTKQAHPDNPFPIDELAMPVYSLSTNGTGAGGGPSMNILTYASLVSLKPRIYAIGLYRDTLSWQNFIDSRSGVLQVLRKKHLPLVKLLGHTSGRDVDKLKEIEDMGFVVSQFLGQNVIADCFGLIELELVSQPMTVGDHDVVICEVGAHLTNRRDGADVLTTADIRAAGIPSATSQHRSPPPSSTPGVSATKKLSRA